MFWTLCVQARAVELAPSPKRQRPTTIDNGLPAVAPDAEGNVLAGLGCYDSD